MSLSITPEKIREPQVMDVFRGIDRDQWLKMVKSVAYNAKSF